MKHPVRWEARLFKMQKSGNDPEYYEDATALDGPAGRFAMADGATDSIFADQWARLLVGSALTAPEALFSGPEALPSWLAPLRRQWVAQIDWPRLPWNVLERAERGAFATLLALHMERDGRWNALAIGDTCAFVIRNGDRLWSFPCTHSDDFGSHPALLASLPGAPDLRPERILFTKDQVQPGDQLLLMTDALAHWFLRGGEAGEAPWKELVAVTDDEAFCRLVEDQRAASRLRNDDVTLLVIDVHADAGEEHDGTMAERP